MEWSPNALAEPSDNLPAPVAYHRPCHYADNGASFLPQWQPLTPPIQEPE
jgi:hypothetical protein